MWREELTMLETRTLGILPPRDVDELLDVANLLGLRHMNDDQTRARSLQDEQSLLTILALVLSLSVPLSALDSQTLFPVAAIGSGTVQFTDSAE